MTLRSLSLLLLMLAAAPAARAEDAALLKQLEDVDTRAGAIKDFTADFRQEKFTPLLKKPLISTGVIRVSGAVIRWDTREPEPAVMHSDGREIRMYYPSQKLLEIYTIDQRLGELAASPLPRLTTLREHFTIEQSDGKRFDAPPVDKDAKTLPLRLVPREKSLAEHVAAVHVLLDTKAAHIVQLEIEGADEDRTRVTFSKVRLDSGVKPADLELKVPEGTAVSRPLEVKGE